MKYFKTAIICALTIFLSLKTFAQTAPNKYLIQLSDKNNNNFSIYNPEEFLSAKAITRRNNQNINITTNDLPVTSAYTDSISALGLKILNTSKWFNAITVYTTDTVLIDTIHKISFIKSVKKTATLKTKQSDKFKISEITNNFQKSSNTSFQDNPYSYGSSDTQICMLNGNILHKNGYSGQGKTIAIIDAGFYSVDTLPAFDSLWTNNQIIGTKDFVQANNNVFREHNHGMKVLSILAGNIPNFLIGSAPKANYWLLRSEDVSSEYTIEEDNWISAAEFADSAGVDIINTSLGYSEFDDSLQNYSYSDMDGNTTRISKAADLASSKGILVVVSAGNSGDDAWEYITAPADADSVIAVGAVDNNMTYAAFSSRGPSYDGRVKPNIAAMGSGTIHQTENGEIAAGNGTSFSAPIISGLAACLWQKYPELTNMQIKKKIEESANQFSSPGIYLGYGIPNFALAADLTEIKNVKNKIIIKAYPNPFSNNINIEIKKYNKSYLKIELINIQGQIIYCKISKNNKIDIDNLEKIPKGIYLLKISTKNTIYTKTLIKK
ncbi:MAG: S8 family serine peptidase [Bacteroidota bacterium]|nr:S8 family serine peptidase [Bacteroidota bacterium]